MTDYIDTDIWTDVWHGYNWRWRLGSDHAAAEASIRVRESHRNIGQRRIERKVSVDRNTATRTQTLK